ncbi:MAG: flagellar biosynthetic protein FliQ [Melioribacteraceae bacterium]|jgi:flagellar biosynthetic protein FliQ|nr:flagellar biosynthetic protein FliQ [Melioribacteraceae bacterium]RJP63118.1 MAG: flagellar type III secretion system protein FliQ [Ignavibacteriales bacterium]WKZ70163.1 MAG: flagellar biosynthetic protein FliQ [Melioribacteraceae bacterium]
MTEELVIEVLTEVFYTVFIILLPILGVSLVVGIAISIFQAVTSIQEMTLTFVPKILFTAVMIVFLIPWILDKLISITLKLFNIMVTIV